MIYISLDSIRCHEETDEAGSDEPYVLVAVVDLRASVAVAGFPVPLPASQVYLYGPFGDVDSAETHFSAFRPFWGMFGEERGLASPDDAILLVGLMENDEGNPDGVRGIVAAQIAGALFSSLNVTDRATRVNLVRQAFNSGMQAIPPIVPPLDDPIGGPQELRFAAEELALAEAGNPAWRHMQFSGDGGHYRATFQARRRGQNAWRFCGKCRTFFFDGSGVKGVCPAGGGHAMHGANYFAPHGSPMPWGGQPDWRFCNRCFAMYWAGDPANQGLCPAGGAHNGAGSYPFFLPHDHAGPGQDQWRFCDRCRVMFWDGEPNKGVCKAGGGQRAQGFNFKLEYAP